MLYLSLILSTMLMYSTPLIFASLGGIISENSGVVNIGLEGMMCIGAFFGAAAANFFGNPWLGFLVGGLAGAVFGLLHAIASITFRADQVVSSIAINLLAPGLAIFFCKIFYDGSAMTPLVEHKIPLYLDGLFKQGSFLDNVFNVYATTYLAFICVFAMWYVLYKTKYGLRIRAVGEHPHAAATLGVSVYRVRYACVILSGFFAGLGGASLSLGIVSNFSQTLISGQGFIALAAVIFGQWKPQGAMLASLFFGLCTSIVVFLGNPVINLNLSSQLLSTIPYISTLVILIFVGNKSIAPAADGIVYVKDSR